MSETKIKDLRINKGLTKQQLIESATITENELSFVTDDSVVDVPAPTEAGKVLTSTEDGVEWAEGGSGGGLPDQTGNDGKFLTTDGTNASWGTELTDALIIRRAPWDNCLVLYNGPQFGSIYMSVLNNMPAFNFSRSLLVTGNIVPAINGYELGSSSNKWVLHSQKINNGADITVPTTGGTMVVATPATSAGMVLVSTENGSEWSDVIGDINTLLDSINGEVA